MQFELKSVELDWLLQNFPLNCDGKRHFPQLGSSFFLVVTSFPSLLLFKQRKLKFRVHFLALLKFVWERRVLDFFNTLVGIYNQNK